MELNILAIFACGLIPMIVGFIYYHPKVMGTAWMHSAGLTEEDLKKGNMLVIMGISFLLAVLLSAMMVVWTVHQLSVQGLLVMMPEFQDVNSEVSTFFADFMSKYGDRHRTFGHGAVHGVFAGVGIALPIIAIKSLFERKSWKYILISVLYWLITLVLICGCACQFGIK